MFLRFGVTNHRSFRDPAEISFVSSAQRDAPEHRVPYEGAPHGVLPVVGVFGANASGKSVLLNAVVRLSEHVANSFTRPQPGDPTPWQPWRNDQSPKAPPTALDADLVLDGARYHYGVTLRADGVETEWLCAWPNGRRRLVFSRYGQDWTFGAELRGAKMHIREATRPNALFLSTAAQFNHPLLGRLAAKFAGIVVSDPMPLQGHPLVDSSSPLLAPDKRDLVRRLLRASDLGVCDFEVREHKVDGGALREAAKLLPAEALADLERRLRDRHELVLVRENDGERWRLEPDDESSGTHMLLWHLHTILHVLDQGTLLVADELHTSLHPDLCRELVALFTTPGSNPRGAQLLFSSHDGSLLSALRRDEVVLVDKPADGASTLRAGSDFRGVRGRDDLVRAWRDGRMGGVPAVGNLASVVERYAHG